MFINRGSTDYVGLFGYIDSPSVIRNTGLLSINVTGHDSVGGLIGWNSGGPITASYASGSVTGAGDRVGGLVGVSFGTITASYWDTSTSGQTASDGGIGKTTSQLQAPTGYTSIYANWNVDIDGNAGGDNPWDFGTESHYPKINYVPSAPATLNAMSGDRLVTLKWTTGSSVLPITKYQFQGDRSGRGWQDISGSDASTTSYTVTGLNNGQSYTFRVRAVNRAGIGEASGSVAATPLALPNQPVDLRATPGANSVILDWSAASADQIITRYQFQGDGSGRGWQDIPGSDASTTSYTVTGLTNGQSYTFRVRAVNQLGPSPASDRVQPRRSFWLQYR